MVAYSFKQRFAPPILAGLLLGPSPAVEIGGEPAITDAAGLNLFARFDGFADWSDLCAFWAAEHEALIEFSGQLIRWEPRS